MADRPLDDGLDDEQQTILAHMIVIREHWDAWQRDRVNVLLFAASLIDRGVLSIQQVCTALGISESSWYRHARALRPVRGSETERLAVATIDEALRSAGADENTTLDDVKSNPDMGLALMAVGVHHRTEEG